MCSRAAPSWRAPGSGAVLLLPVDTVPAVLPRPLCNINAPAPLLRHFSSCSPPSLSHSSTMFLSPECWACQSMSEVGHQRSTRRQVKYNKQQVRTLSFLLSYSFFLEGGDSSPFSHIWCHVWVWLSMTDRITAAVTTDSLLLQVDGCDQEQKGWGGKRVPCSFSGTLQVALC